MGISKFRFGRSPVIEAFLLILYGYILFGWHNHWESRFIPPLTPPFRGRIKEGAIYHSLAEFKLAIKNGRLRALLMGMS